MPIETLRDLLLPGVVAHVNKRFGAFSRVRYDLAISGRALDLVLCRGELCYRQQILSAKDIADGTYKDKFGHRMVWLMNGAAEIIGE